MREQAEETQGPPFPADSFDAELRAASLGTAERADVADGGDRAATHDGAGGRGSRAALEWVVLIAAAVLIAIVIRAFVFQAFYIPSESMVPTLKVGDRVLVNKLSYQIHDPERGDVVVFKAPALAATGDVKDLVKRVVGLPNETIEGRDGHIYIDGRLLTEPYLPAGVVSRTFAPEHVPAESYFMLGDNRQFSKDSTFFHSIKRSDFIGREFVRIWPLDRLSFPLWPVALIALAGLLSFAAWLWFGRREDAPPA